MRYAVGVVTATTDYEAEQRYLAARASGDREAIARAERAWRGAGGGRPGATYEGDMREMIALLRDAAPKRGRAGATMAGDLAAVNAVLRNTGLRCGAPKRSVLLCNVCRGNVLANFGDPDECNCD